MENIKRTLHDTRKDLLCKENVMGVGIGKKTTRGNKTDETSILVFVRKKKEKGLLRKRDIVPAKIMGIKTDVVESDEFRALPATDRIRPAVPGISIGHLHVTAGTFGGVVRSKDNGEKYILSNNHVLANATDGSDGRAEIGDIILQPGTADGGDRDNDIIARLDYFFPLIKDIFEPRCKIANMMERAVNNLIRHFKPYYRVKIEKLTSSANLVDAALAKPINDNDIGEEILNIGRVSGVGQPIIGDAVKKMGRTTGLTFGAIDALDVSMMVRMPDNASAFFESQVLSNIRSQPGDSGSLVLNMDNQAVGLLFAGSSTSTLINHIDHVLNELQIEI